MPGSLAGILISKCCEKLPGETGHALQKPMEKSRLDQEAKLLPTPVSCQSTLLITFTPCLCTKEKYLVQLCFCIAGNEKWTWS